MNEIDHFKKFVFYSDDVAADVDYCMSREFISRFLLYSYRRLLYYFYISLFFYFYHCRHIYTPRISPDATRNLSQKNLLLSA
jgi:hypothetical protein